MSLVFWAACACGIDRYPIVLSEPLELGVKDRFVTDRFGYRALQVIRNNGFGDAAVIVKCVLAGRDKSSLR